MSSSEKGHVNVVTYPLIIH